MTLRKHISALNLDGLNETNEPSSSDILHNATLSLWEYDWLMKQLEILQEQYLSLKSKYLYSTSNNTDEEVDDEGYELPKHKVRLSLQQQIISFLLISELQRVKGDPASASKRKTPSKVKESAAPSELIDYEVNNNILE